MKKNLILLFPALFGLILSGCVAGKDSENPSSSSSSESGQTSSSESSEGTSSSSSEESKQDFVGVEFASAEYVYDGQPHILNEVTGAPENTIITYTGRDSYVNVGTYNATAKLVKDGYNDKTLNATLVIKKADFTGLTYSSRTVTYDGNDYYSLIDWEGNLPNGTTESLTVKNSNNQVVTSAIHAGVYSYSLTLTNPNYNSLTLTATLTINKANFSGYTYESKSVTYDGEEHINDIQLVGVLPQGTTTEETVKNSDNEIVTSAVDVGVYSYTCVITNSDYVTTTLHATLTIASPRKHMALKATSYNEVYFTNGLHDNYTYKASNVSDASTKHCDLALVDYSTTKKYVTVGGAGATFISSSVLQNAVKNYNSDTLTTLYTGSSITDYFKESNTIAYYSSNSLISSKSGIFKVDTTDADNEPIVTRVFDGRCSNLVGYNEKIYFINHSDHDYLYRFNPSNGEVSLVSETKLHEFTLGDSGFYCCVNGTLNDYIGLYSFANNELTKITDDAGEDLKVVNGYLYYNYTDLYGAIDSSKKGVWKIRCNLTSQKTQVVQSGNICGYDVSDNTNYVYYIDLENLHLYRYDQTASSTLDLLNDFVAPEETPLNMGGQTISLGTKTYYLNMYAGKTLYAYDEVTKKSSQLTTNKVEDFYIYNGIMYFNQVTLFTNNDLYSVNLATGGEAEKLNSNDVRNMVSDGTYLYATHYNWAGTAGGLSRMKLDGSEYVKFSEVNGAKNLSVKDDKLYYINCTLGQDNGYIEYMNLSDITSSTTELEGTKLSNNIKNVKQFIFEGNNIYYIYNGTIDNSVRRTDFTTLSDGVKLASTKTNPNEIILKGSYVYYYSYAASAVSSAGFYRVSKDATGDGTQELLVGYDSKYFGSNLSISDSGYLYFLNYIPKLTFGDAHFYQIKLSDNSIIKIA